VPYPRNRQGISRFTVDVNSKLSEPIFSDIPEIIQSEQVPDDQVPDHIDQVPDHIMVRPSPARVVERQQQLPQSVVFTRSVVPVHLPLVEDDIDCESISDCDEEPPDFTASPPVSPAPSSPPGRSSAVVDWDGDGRPNAIVTGIDTNNDGIPDALQRGVPTEVLRAEFSVQAGPRLVKSGEGRLTLEIRTSDGTVSPLRGSLTQDGFVVVENVNGKKGSASFAASASSHKRIGSFLTTEPSFEIVAEQEGRVEEWAVALNEDSMIVQIKQITTYVLASTQVVEKLESHRAGHHDGVPLPSSPSPSSPKELAEAVTPGATRSDYVESSPVFEMSPVDYVDEVVRVEINTVAEALANNVPWDQLEELGLRAEAREQYNRSSWKRQLGQSLPHADFV